MHSVNPINSLNKPFYISSYSPVTDPTSGEVTMQHNPLLIRTVYNTPLFEYDPAAASELAMVQWPAKAKPKELRQLMTTPITVTLPGRKDPVTLYGDKVGGSPIKQGKTTAISERLWHQSAKALGFGEDFVRWNRWAIPNSTTAIRGSFTVEMVPDHTPLTFKNGYQLEAMDGFGIIRASMLESVQDRTRFGKVAYRTDWDTGDMFLQQFKRTPDLWAELTPRLADKTAELASGKEFIFSDSCDLDSKRPFVEASPEMMDHPWVLRSLGNSFARFLYRVATCGDIKGCGGVLIPRPTKSDDDTHVVMMTQERTIDGKRWTDKRAIGFRWPIEPGDTLQQVMVDNQSEESQWLTGLEVIQYTINNHMRQGFKGILAIIPDDQWPEEYESADIVCTVNDEKINHTWRRYYKEQLKATDNDSDKALEALKALQGHPRRYELDDAILSVTMWWQGGQTFAVTNDLNKEYFRGDFDGDTAELVPADNFPELWRQVGQLPHVPNQKLLKRKTPNFAGVSYSATTFMLPAMNSLIGQYANLFRQSWATNNRPALAQLVTAIKDPVEAEEQLDKWLAYGIKVGTDAFKTWVPDLSEVKRRLARLRDEIGLMVSAPYTNWKRNGAFKDWVPVVSANPDAIPNSTIAENAIHADPNVAGGLINDVLRYTLPSIYVPEVDDHKPLRWFRDWAIKPQDVADFQFVDRMIRVYNNLVGGVNWSAASRQANQSDRAEDGGDQEEISHWDQAKETWLALVESYQKTDYWGTLVDRFGSDEEARWMAANWLFWLAHDREERASDWDGTNYRNSVSVAFVTFEAEALRIVGERPGLATVDNTVIEVVVPGMSNQDPHARLGKEYGQVEVQTISYTNQRKGGAREQRQVIVATDPLTQLNLTPPRQGGLPRGLLGFIERNTSQLEGTYQAKVTGMKGKTPVLTLSR